MRFCKQIVLVLGFICLFASKANSCDCERSIGFDGSKIVFKGKVIKVVNNGMYEITFRVYKVEKGEVRSKKIVIRTPCLNDGCCGINFKKHEVYRVFAYDGDKRLYTDQCTQTRKIEKGGV